MIKEKVCVAHMLLCNCFCTRKGFMIKESLCGTHAFVQLQYKGRFYDKRKFVAHMLFCSYSTTTRKGSMIKEKMVWYTCFCAATVQGKVL